MLQLPKLWIMEESKRNTNLKSCGYNDFYRIFYLSTISFCLGKILNTSILILLVDKLPINIHHLHGMDSLIVHTKIMRMGKKETQRPLSYTINLETSQTLFSCYKPNTLYKIYNPSCYKWFIAFCHIILQLKLIFTVKIIFCRA